MARKNPNFKILEGGYLFPVVNKRRDEFVARTGHKVFDLGVGNTKLPLGSTTIKAIQKAAFCMGVLESLYSDEELARLGEGAAIERLLHEAGLDKYNGYGSEQGNKTLRAAIAGEYARLGVALDPSEIFASDGAKCDAGNIQMLFSLEDVIAVQDPAYPVYVDSNVIAGRTGPMDKATLQYEGVVYMPCTAENGFFPEMPSEKVDIIYYCSPNNPTGAVATKEQLKQLVDFARERKAVIIFDAAYAAFIQDPSLPKSIYEIEGAKECAIEINSFSKAAGFTGMRLGYAVVPQELVVEDSVPGELNGMWNRRQCTFFNGASNIIQAAGLAALSEQGHAECQENIDGYMGNARLEKDNVESMGLTAFGGDNAPYVWFVTPNKEGSWDFTKRLLEEAHVVATPGAGFGPSGEFYSRFSAFPPRDVVVAAMESMKKNLRL
jgi:LL-diaminopimelate aminotransferase